MLTIAEVFKQIDGLPEKKDRIGSLKALSPRYLKPVRTLLKYVYDPALTFDLSDDVPYTPCTFDEPGILFGEIRRLYIFTVDGNPNLTREKRDKLFGELLSTIAPSDALMMREIVKKGLPFKNITKEVATKAFPDLMEK